ncbi:putative pyridine nucleotide-disulfide oxidoreductase RclA [Dyadobacter sp. CECT 9623]|uniref:Pyridine nucleotide-disulfide oxidoreductase RclA n=1 Tax=Dyadobacter linearis TaxID=2823330 RepID=A0ABN7R7E2_9BACT|nr:mercuric reductase [Dyadobacter sp. CECT 9623]CAG5069324.1 putative pyridine nucleotide-disulfide oxidoreductase RclA [Dyadobacter sp. CECT 9623]
MKHYDAVVIGSGQAGTPLSRKLAQSGKKTALIERRFAGGTCVNDGCSPTKAMIASAKAAWVARNSSKLGVSASDIKIDFETIRDRKDEIVKSMRGSLEKGFAGTENLEVIYGDAHFSGEKEITISLNDGGSEVVSGELIFINTGLSPVIPDIPGIQEIHYLTSTSILDIEDIPEHLLILGSGYIGLEFGQMFSRFGSKVTIIEPSERIMKHEDEDIAAEITKILAEENIEILINSKVTAFTRNEEKILAKIKKHDQEHSFEYSHILIATGRKPNTDRLSLDVAGVELDDKGFIVVNDSLETSAKGIYALGDIKGGMAFTHISYDDYRVVAANVIDKKQSTIKGRQQPYCMFIDPQLGRIGMTEQDARDEGLDIDVYTIKNDSVARSIETGNTRGMMKAVVDKKSGKILGAAVLAEQGGEVVTILELAIMGGITFDKLRDGIFAHPTYAESLNNLFMSKPH